jgi:hypothetical protein
VNIRRVDDLKPQDIAFPNGNRARMVFTMHGTTPESIVRALAIPIPEPLIVIVGGAAGLDRGLERQLKPLFREGIACAASDTGALILDGGTRAGVMEIMGIGIAGRVPKPILLGVAPRAKVTYPGRTIEKTVVDSAPLDPNHSHFALVEADKWGGETGMMYDLADLISRGTPSVAVLANGGPLAVDEMLLSIRAKREIIVIGGSGRLADEIASAMAQSGRQHRAEVKAIAAYESITLFDIRKGAQELRDSIKMRLSAKR